MTRMRAATAGAVTDATGREVVTVEDAFADTEAAGPAVVTH
ncbi:hypothetical protein [Streptomyces sp. Pv4-95]